MKIGPPVDKTAAPPVGTPARPEPAVPMKAGQPGKAGTVGAPAGNAAIPSQTSGAAPVQSRQGSVESSANVQLSNTASDLISSQKAANADIDTEKVSRVSQQIADNTYQVNAAAIADKLIANAQELLGKVPE